MNQTEKILSQLRDVQLPAAPETVPAWLIALNLLLLLLIMAGIYLRWQRRREQWRRDALDAIRRAASMEPESARVELARLLRQVLLFQRWDISAHGEAWLRQLDTAFATRWFSQAEGQAFGSALYRPSTLTDAQVQGLCNGLTRLIKQLPATTRTPAGRTNLRDKR